MAGQYDLGLARGKVVVDYSSSGVKQVQADLKKVQDSVKNSNLQWAATAAHYGVGIPQLQKYIEVQKAVTEATRTAAFFEANLASAKKRSGTGSMEAVRAEMMAVKARKSLVDITKTLQAVEGNLPSAMASRGSVLANDFSNSFLSTATRKLGGSGGIAGMLKGALAGAAKGIVVGGAVAAAAAATAGIAAVGVTLNKGFGRIAAIDEAETKMKALGRSAKEVESIMNSANESVLKTSFSLASAATVAAQAVGAEMPAGPKLTQYLKEVADAAAVSGTSMEAMGDIFVRIQGSGIAYTEDLMMMSRQGIPIWKALAKEYGVSEAKLRKMVEAGAVDSKTFRKVLAENIGGAAAKMGDSISGSLKNLDAALSRLGGTLLAPLKKVIPAAINWITEQLDKLNKWAVTHQRDIAAFFGAIAKGAIRAAQAINNFVAQSLRDFSDFAGMISAILTPIVAVEEALAKIGIGGKEARDLRKALDTLEGFSEWADKSGKSLDQNNKSFEKWLKDIEQWVNEFTNDPNAGKALAEQFGETEEAAVSLEEQLDKLGLSQDNLQEAVEGSEEQFRKLLKTLKDKRASQELVNQVIAMRNAFNRAGPGARDLAKALDLLSDKGADASTKTQALIKALKEIGLLPNDDALANFNQTLDDMTDYANVGVDTLSKFGSELVNVDNTINTTSKNGQTLWRKLQDAQNAAFNAASSGQLSPAQAWQEAHDALLLVLSDFHIFGPQAEAIIENYLLPKHSFEVEFTQRGGDDLRKELTSLFNQIDAAKKAGENKVDFRIEVNGDKDELQKQVEALGGSVVFDPMGVGATITIPPSAELDAKRRELEEQWKLNTEPLDIPGKVSTPNQSDELVEAATGGEPLDLPGKVNVPEDRDGISEQATGGKPVEVPATLVFPPELLPYVEGTPEPPSAGAAPAPPNPGDYNPFNSPDAGWRDIWAWLKERYGPEAWVGPGLGYNGARGTAGQGYFDSQAASDALDLATQQTTGDNLAITAQRQGQNFSEAFAEGILEGVQKVNEAALELAKKASEPLGQSPAPYGPLSGSGWTFTRGAKFSRAFAAGIISGSGTVNRASLSLAEGSTGTLQEQIGIFLKDYGEMSEFIKHAFDFVTSLGDIAFNVLALAQNLSGGRLFPKTYVKDPAKAEETRKRREREKQRQDIATQGYTTPPTPHGIGGRGPERMQRLPEPQRDTGAQTPSNFQFLTKPRGKNGLEDFLINSLQRAGLSNDVIRGIVAMNQVESGGKREGFLGFTYGQAATPEKAVERFLKEQWFPRTKGGTPGVDANGTVTNWDDLMTFIRTKIVGQNGVIDWQGNQQPPASEYQRRLMDALGLPSGGGMSRIRSGSLALPRGAVAATPMSLPGRGLTYSKQTIRRLGIPQLYTPGEYPYSKGGGGLPDWAYALGNRFNLSTSSSISASGINSTHGAGNAFDFSGSPQDMERMAQYLLNDPTMKSQLLQLIYRGSRDYEVAGGQTAPGYYGGDEMARHTDHLHGAFASPVLPGDMANFFANAPIPVTLSSNVTDSLDSIDKNTADTNDFGLPPLVDQLAQQDELLRQAVEATRQGTATAETAPPMLQHLDDLIAQQNKLNTDQGKSTANYLSGIRENLMGQAGLMEGPDVLGQVQNIAQGTVGLAQDIFAIVDSSMQAVAGANDMANTLARGIQNTEDIFKAVDSIQTFIKVAQDVASAVGDGLALAATIAMAAGGQDAGATSTALSAAASVSQIVASVYSAVNAWIDIGQEAYRIGTKYIGRALQDWFGLSGATDIKYLLDTVTGQMKVYSSENPDYKTTMNTLGRQLFGEANNYSTRESPQNTFYIYQGPGQDPRDTMSNAMFAIKSSGVGAFGYD